MDEKLKKEFYEKYNLIKPSNLYEITFNIKQLDLFFDHSIEELSNYTIIKSVRYKMVKDSKPRRLLGTVIVKSIDEDEKFINDIFDYIKLKYKKLNDLNVKII